MWAPVGLSTAKGNELTDSGNEWPEVPDLGRATVRLPVAGGVAQLVERLGRIEEARGSIPLTSTAGQPSVDPDTSGMRSGSRRVL